MYAVNIALGTTVWRLLFKTEENARATFEKLKDHLNEMKVADDFGQELVINPGCVSGLMFEDLDQSKLANIELFLHQQRVQVAAQKAAQSDPGLKASSLMNGPSVLTPNFQRQ